MSQRRTIDGSFAAYLQAAMNAARISNGARLAEMSGIGQSLVSRWLNGKSIPSIENLRAIAEPLGVPMRDLVIRAGHMTSEEFGLEEEPTPPTGRHSIEDEIRADPRIRDDRKEVLIGLLESLRDEYSDTRTGERSDRSA